MAVNPYVHRHDVVCVEQIVQRGGGGGGGGGLILRWAGLESTSIQCGRLGCYKGGCLSSLLMSRRQILDFHGGHTSSRRAGQVML